MTERNYAQEAAQIIAGESPLLPQKEHLVAMAGQMASVTKNLELTLRLLTAILHDAGQTEMHFPQGLLEEALTGQTRLAIIGNADQSVTVRREPIPLMAIPRRGSSLN